MATVKLKFKLNARRALELQALFEAGEPAALAPVLAEALAGAVSAGKLKVGVKTKHRAQKPEKSPDPAESKEAGVRVKEEKPGEKAGAEKSVKDDNVKAGKSRKSAKAEKSSAASGALKPSEPVSEAEVSEKPAAPSAAVQDDAEAKASVKTPKRTGTGGRKAGLKRR